MKHAFPAVVACIIVGLYAAVAAGAGDPGRGRTIFADPTFAGGTRACSSCHPDGKGLEKAGSKKEFHIMGQTQKSLEEAVNACIVGAIGGRAIPVNSQQMQDVTSYIRSLKQRKSSSGY